MRAPGGCERRIAPGALCCRSGSFPPIPAGTARKYSKHAPLTVSFRSQVQIIWPLRRQREQPCLSSALGRSYLESRLRFCYSSSPRSCSGTSCDRAGSERRPRGRIGIGGLRSTTSTPLLCQWLLKAIQHGLRFHTPSEPKAHCGLSQWRQTAWVGRASTGDHQHSWEVPMAVPRIAQHNPIQLVC